MTGEDQVATIAELRERLREAEKLKQGYYNEAAEGWARARAAERALVEARDRNVQHLAEAHEWMVCHDRLKAGLPYEFPSPASARLAADVLAASERRGIAEAKILQAALAELKPAPEKIAILEAELSAACTEWRAAVAAWRAGRSGGG